MCHVEEPPARWLTGCVTQPMAFSTARTDQERVYEQRGAAFQASDLQSPRVTLQGAFTTGSESSKVSLLHHPEAGMLNHPSTVYFQNLQVQPGYSQWEPAGDHSPRPLTCPAVTQKKILHMANPRRAEGKAFAFPQSRMFSSTQTKVHHTCLNQQHMCRAAQQAAMVSVKSAHSSTQLSFLCLPSAPPQTKGVGAHLAC